MGQLTIPARLADGSAGQPARQDWLARLPGVISAFAASWRLSVGAPFEPGGACSWVAPVRTASGERRVLKVMWRHLEAEHEADALRLWDGAGAVRLHAFERTADTDVLLLERCVPGTALRELPEPEQDEIICAVLRRLWREPPAVPEFPALTAMCGYWADRYEERRSARRPPEPGLDLGLVRAGLALFRELPVTAGHSVVLATDLHGENVLSATREPWLAIDPKPHVGDPAYDPLQHMINCDRLVTDPVGLARRIAQLLDLDPGRMRRWLFARCVIDSDQPELAAAAVALAP